MTEHVSASDPSTEQVVEPGSQWRRLDARMLIVGPLNGLVQLLPVLAILVITGRSDPFRMWLPVVLAVLVVIAGVLRWRTTRYRITPERVELRSGWLRRQRRSIPRDRIRTVDATARLVHRLFGLSVVQIGSGTGMSFEHGVGLRLDAVSGAEAERLRRELLDPSALAERPDAPAGAPQPAASPPVVELARLDWRWLRFAPLTVSSLAAIGAVFATLYNLFDDLGVDPRDLDAVDSAVDRIASASIWAGVAVVALTLLVLAVAGSLVLFAERWYGYRLTREADGALRVGRGLLTRRSLSVAEQRLRGVEVLEPLLLRLGGGAQSRALTTGLAREAGSGALQPPVPRAEAHRVAAAALREDPAVLTLAPLRRHTRAARMRRLTRAVGPTVAIVAAAWVVTSTGGPSWVGPVSLVLLPAALWVGWDRARNLGHALTPRYLVMRSGSLRRQTVALQRTGIVGWSFRQSVFQRRSGLVNLEAITAAGSGGYTVLDLTVEDAVALADTATPGVLPRPRSGATMATTDDRPQLDHRVDG